MTPRIATVVLNSEDAPRLVAFWCAFMGSEPAHEGEGITWLTKADGAGVGLAIQQVARKLGAHTETHLDIVVDDIDAAQRTVESLGGRLVAVNRLDDGFEWRIVADVDGNEFCIFAGH